MGPLEILRLEWVRTLLVAAASAVAAYGWKSWIEGRERKRKERASTIGALQDLKSLLDTSRALFSIQQGQVKRLMEMLKQNHPAEYAQGRGYDDRLTRCHPLFNPQEKELHGIIRAYTEHSMLRVNEAIRKWLDDDKQFKTGQVESERREELAGTLRELEMHLLLWHAKFEYWIPTQPQHALVYLADEEAHGLGFPKDRTLERNGVEVQVDGVDTEVARVLEELRGKK
jgi:hypothetical protein